jgi:hypothetical protein
MSNSTQEHNNEKLSMDELQRISVKNLSKVQAPDLRLFGLCQKYEQRSSVIRTADAFDRTYFFVRNNSKTTPQRNRKNSTRCHRIGELVLLSRHHEAITHY